VPNKSLMTQRSGSPQMSAWKKIADEVKIETAE
jgi:hypothetical protein